MEARSAAVAIQGTLQAREPSKAVRQSGALGPAPQAFVSSLAPSGTLPVVDLRPLKQTAEEFGPSHPLRILLAGEPDEILRDEYYSKLPGWFRLLRAKA